NAYSPDVPAELRHGLAQQDGELRLLGSRITGIESFTGGTLTGFGGTGGLVLTAGAIAPGLTGGPDDPIGVIDFDYLILDAGAIIELDLAGVSDDAFDRLLIDQQRLSPTGNF